MTRRLPIAALLIMLLAATACSRLAPRARALRPVPVEGGVKFTYFAPNATVVQLAGSWPGNFWAHGDGGVGEMLIGLMSDDNTDGTWELVVPLTPGRYQYLFLVDENTWHLDPGNPEEVPAGPMRTASEIVVFMRNGKLEVR
jgi:1,4-alpha-glucan branching enzyme